MAITITLPDVGMTFNKADFASYEDDLRMRPGGVYAFYDNRGKCLYVGQSKNLNARLRSHFAASPFNNEIYRVDIRFVEDPFDREVYETYAITTLGGIYNRAKKYVLRASSPLISGEIDDISCEIDALSIERADITHAIEDIRGILYPPIPRKFNNWTGEVSEAYHDYIEYYRRDVHDTESAGMEYEYGQLKSRLAEIDVEIAELYVKRSELTRKLIT